MAYKQVSHAELGLINLYKRKNSKHIKLSVSHDGHIQVSLPFWAPYKVGLDYAIAKKDWLLNLKAKLKPTLITDGMSIGKAHRVDFSRGDTSNVKTRLKNGTVYITVPLEAEFEDTHVQIIARKACERALKKEAETLLLQRLKQLSAESQLTCNSLSFKKMKGRWGSCSSNKDIVLNIFLMQLTWELIDYVILHELVHTVHMSHDESFWGTLDGLVKNLPEKRKLIKEYQPKLIPRQISSMSYEA